MGFVNTLDEKSKTEYQQIKTEIREQTEPIWKEFHPTTPKYRDYIRERKKIVRQLDKSIKNLDMLSNILNSVPESKMIQCLITVLDYLTSVETLGDQSANLILLFLAVDGHHIHLQPDSKHWYVRHATQLEDFETPTLSLKTKIDFLDSHGFKFFSKWIKTGLRNKIAHSDFHIDKDGNFFIIKEKKDGTETEVPFDLEKENLRFKMYSVAFTILFGEQLEKFSTI